MRNIISIAAVTMSVACGSSGDPVDAVRTQSQVVLTEPPTRHMTGRVNGWHWSADSESPRIHFYGPGDDADVELEGESILLVHHRTLGEIEYLVVGVLDGDDRYTIYRLHDSTEDGRPDFDTATVLLSFSEPCYITSASILENGRAFLLDRRCQDVLLATDTGGDGWPDSVATAPFAMSDNFAALLEARSVSASSISKVSTTRVTNASGMLGGLITRTHYEDSDGNESADAESVTRPVIGTPIPVGKPYDGQTSVFVLGLEGWTIEIRHVDAEGNVGDSLGSGTIDATNEVEIELSSALVEGDALLYKRVDAGAGDGDRIALRVDSDRPQITATDPAVFTSGATQTLEVEGFRFVTGTTFHLRRGDEVLPLTAIILSLRKATVTVPPIAPENAGNYQIVALGSGEEIASTAGRGDSIRVCQPDDPE